MSPLMFIMHEAKRQKDIFKSSRLIMFNTWFSQRRARVYRIKATKANSFAFTSTGMCLYVCIMVCTLPDSNIMCGSLTKRFALGTNLKKYRFGSVFIFVLCRHYNYGNTRQKGTVHLYDTFLVIHSVPSTLLYFNLL